MLQKILQMGPLRNALHATAIIFACLMPFAAGPTYSDDWNLFFSGILPATAPIIVILIGLDFMITQIWKSDASDNRLVVLNSIHRMHLIVGGILLTAWLAVFLPVLT
jgi:hypothetical protein